MVGKGSILVKRTIHSGNRPLNTTAQKKFAAKAIVVVRKYLTR